MKFSYKYVQASTKEAYKRLSAKVYETREDSFKEFSDYLASDAIVIPNIAFKDNHKMLHNAILPTMFEMLAFDVDDTSIDIDTMHEMLTDYNINHILVCTSNPDNKCKYRVFLELKPIEISSHTQLPELYSFVPSFIPYDKAAVDLARCYFIYEKLEYTIKEYHNGKPIEVTLTNKVQPRQHTPTCEYSVNNPKLSYKAKTTQCVYHNLGKNNFNCDYSLVFYATTNQHKKYN